MAEYYGNISGNKTNVRKYAVDGGITIDAGEPVISGVDVAANGGATTASTTAAAAMLGFAIDSATSTDAQTGTATDNVNSVTTIVNPDALWRALLSNDASDSTALVVCSAAQAANAAGTTVTGATDEATIWGYTGANSGKVRRATDAATTVVAFPHDIAALDTFLETLVAPGYGSQMATLNTSLTQVAARTAVATTDYGVFELLLRDSANDGTTNSFAILFAGDHAFKNANS